MSIKIFLIIYFVLNILLVICELWFLSNDKHKYYLKISYKSLKSICEDFSKDGAVFNQEYFTQEINKFYHEILQEFPRINEYYPNVVVWLNAIIFRIDWGRKGASDLTQYTQILKEARNTLDIKNPFNKCEKYHQGILCDIEKIKTPENEILVQNIVNRTEEEFLRLSGDIKKNYQINFISIAISILGIVFSFLMSLY